MGTAAAHRAALTYTALANDSPKIVRRCLDVARSIGSRPRQPSPSTCDRLPSWSAVHLRLPGRVTVTEERGNTTAATRQVASIPAIATTANTGPSP